MADVTLFLWIAVLLLLAKTFGEIAERLKMSSLVGEVFGGILAGPILHIVQPSLLLEQIAGIGVMLFFFIVGLSTKFDDIKKDVYAGSVLAIVGCLLSFAAGFLVGYAFFRDVNVGIILGVAFLSTSSAIAIRALVEKGEFRSRAGKMLIMANMADDVIGIIALSLLAMYISANIQIWQTALLFFGILGFFFFILTFGSRFINAFLSVFQRMRDEQILLSIPLAIMFFIVYLSENIILAGVTGAFLVGMTMSKSQVTGPVIIPKVKTIGYGFFIPLFFAYSAIALDLSSLYQSFWLILALVITGIIAKVFGSGFFSRFYNFRKHDQWLIGIGMIPRGEYAIIIGQIALAAAIISAQVYTALVAATVITVILTPMMMRFLK